MSTLEWNRTAGPLVATVEIVVLEGDAVVNINTTVHAGHSGPSGKDQRTAERVFLCSGHNVVVNFLELDEGKVVAEAVGAAEDLKDATGSPVVIERAAVKTDGTCKEARAAARRGDLEWLREHGWGLPEEPPAPRPDPEELSEPAAPTVPTAGRAHPRERRTSHDGQGEGARPHDGQGEGARPVGLFSRGGLRAGGPFCPLLGWCGMTARQLAEEIVADLLDGMPEGGRVLPQAHRGVAVDRVRRVLERETAPPPEPFKRLRRDTRELWPGEPGWAE